MKPEDYTKYFEAAQKYNEELAAHPSAFYNPDEIKDYCTLMTCTPYGINTHRLLVRGHCTGTGEPQHIHVTAEAFQIDSTIMASVIGILLLILLLIRVLICTRKKGREGRYSRYDQALLYMKKTDILKNNKRDNNTKN